MEHSPQEVDRFKPAMPRIPGVADESRGDRWIAVLARWKPPAKWAVPFAAAMLIGVGVAWWTLRSPQPATPATTAQSSVSEAQADSAPARKTVSAAAAAAPGVMGSVTTLRELARSWSSKQFVFRSTLSGAAEPALIVRLPGGSSSQPSSYWAFSLQVPFGRCNLELVSDRRRISREFGFQANHPMVVDPCTSTLYDPLRMGTVPNGSWARGEVVQGSGIRPPLSIELRIQGDHIIAVRSE